MLSLLVTVGAVYVGLMVLFLLLEKQMIFFPNMPGRLVGNWQPAGLPVEDVRLTAEDGVSLHAWWIPAPGAQLTFAMFHGNAANLPNRAEIYRFVRSLPANVLAVEYRGYGKSEGTPSEQGLYLDALAAHDYLTHTRGVKARSIVVFGASLGSAVATDLASKREVGALVLEAPFPSTAAVARRIYWFLPGLGRLARSRFETAAKLSQVRAPLLIVHCTQDPVLPIALGEATWRARPDATFVRIEGVCHEDASLVDEFHYREALRALASSLSASSPDSQGRRR